jgi:hypothetical protein
MKLLQRRARRAVALALLIIPLVWCALLGLRAARGPLPSELVRTRWFWVGDLCRATQSATVMYAQICTPGYSVDLVIYGRTPRRYVLIELPRR